MASDPRVRSKTFAEREIAPSAAARDREQRWDGDLYRRMGDEGLVGAAFPGVYGGGDLGANGAAELQAGFGEGSCDAGLALAWCASAFGAGMAILRVGTEAQRRRWIPKLARGEAIGAVARREPAAAGDPIGVRTRARRRDGRWVLSGDKTWVVNGAVADVLVVTAVTDPRRGAEGVSAFLVDKDAPGLQIGRRIETTGMRTAVISEIALRDSEVPDDALLGAEGSGLSCACRMIQRWERAHRFAPWIGFMRALLDRSVAHARRRCEFGRPLSCSQSVRRRLADMQIRLALCERLVSRSAAHLDRGGEHADRDIVAGKLFLSERVVETIRDAHEILGAEAAEAGSLAERLHRDALVLARIGEGTDLLRSIVAGSLLQLG